ncbi:hypothetical protein AB0M44_21300 [Streptosporangium subroseum]|uniref:hypothetical protein n=1 Tax=Streptosporangium subroseum TaxID=106412 RepID=UPI0034497F20
MAKSFRRRAPGTGRIGLLTATAERLLCGWITRGAERVAAAPATGKVLGSLHRAATGLAEATSEVSAYAGLLEEKTGELQARTRARRNSTAPGEFSTASYGEALAGQKRQNQQMPI